MAFRENAWVPEKWTADAAGKVPCPDPLLRHRFDVRQLPRLFKERLFRAIKAEPREVASAGDGGNPVGLLTRGRLRPAKTEKIPKSVLASNLQEGRGG
jgi:hypothetical protein